MILLSDIFRKGHTVFDSDIEREKLMLLFVALPFCPTSNIVNTLNCGNFNHDLSIFESNNKYWSNISSLLCKILRKFNLKQPRYRSMAYLKIHCN